MSMIEVLCRIDPCFLTAGPQVEINIMLVHKRTARDLSYT